MGRAMPARRIINNAALASWSDSVKHDLAGVSRACPVKVQVVFGTMLLSQDSIKVAVIYHDVWQICCLSLALSLTMILRMMATIATIFGLPF